MAAGPERSADETRAPRRGRRAVVHIGLNKTGSNAIHTWLSLNTEVLQRKGFWFDSLGPHSGPEYSTAAGWVAYARAGRADWLPAAHDRQAYRIATRADLDARLATFLSRAEASFPPHEGTFVTSSSPISQIRPKAQIARLHAWFAERFDAVRYVVYLRDQVEWLPSAYGQAVRAGGTQDLDAFIDSQGVNDYDAFVARWQEIVGADAMDVRLYDRRDFVGGDLFEDFAAALGTDTSGMTAPPRRNEAMSAARLKATIAASRLTGSLAERAGLLPLQRRLYTMPLPGPGGAKLTLDPNQASRVRAMNADSNARLCARLFPDRPQLFRGPAHRNASPVPTTELSQVTGK